jgi:hypothetical protein
MKLLDLRFGGYSHDFLISISRRVLGFMGQTRDEGLGLAHGGRLGDSIAS